MKHGSACVRNGQSLSIVILLLRGMEQDKEREEEVSQAVGGFRVKQFSHNAQTIAAFVCQNWYRMQANIVCRSHDKRSSLDAPKNRFILLKTMHTHACIY